MFFNILIIVAGGLEPIPAISGREAGYSLASLMQG